MQAVAVVVAVKLLLQILLVRGERAAVEMEAQALPVLWLKQELQTRAAVAVVEVFQIILLAAQAALALLFCPTPFQKAQSFNSCLLRHGKHQQASPPLITWW
jgi:sulfur carrier protein ThiS